LSTAAPQLVLIAVCGNSSGSRDVGEHRPAPMSSTIRKLEDLPSDGGRTVDTLEKQSGPKWPSCGHDSVEPQAQGVGRGLTAAGFTTLNRSASSGNAINARSTGYAANAWATAAGREHPHWTSPIRRVFFCATFCDTAQCAAR
jgi:hypothetical protein